MKLYQVLKEFPRDGKVVPANETIELDESDAATKWYVDNGYLEEKGATSSLLDDLEASLTKKFVPAIKSAVEGAFDKAMATITPAAPRFAAKGYGGFAEPKEEKSLGELFQCLTYASSRQHPRFEWACDRIRSKYVLTQNPDFDADYEKGLDAQDPTGKAKAEFRKQVAKASAMSETSGSLGGFSIGPEYSAQLFELAGDSSLLMNKVDRYTMTTQELVIPVFDYSLGGSGASPYLGGMTASWGAEGKNFAQTNPSMRDFGLKANILCGYCVASRTLLADSMISLEQVLSRLFAKTIAYYVDLGILTGSGNNQPKGILSSAAAISVNRNSSANGSTLNDVASIEAKLLPESEGRAMWIGSPSVKSQMIQMNDASGRVVWIPNYPNPDEGPAQRPLSYRLTGKPFYVSQLPASSGTSKDLALIDPMAYILGLRQEIEVGVSEHVNFLSYQNTYRFIFRGDGGCPLNTYLTLQNGDTVSPFVYRN